MKKPGSWKRYSSTFDRSSSMASRDLWSRRFIGPISDWLSKKEMLHLCIPPFSPPVHCLLPAERGPSYTVYQSKNKPAPEKKCHIPHVYTGLIIPSGPAYALLSCPWLMSWSVPYGQSIALRQLGLPTSLPVPSPGPDHWEKDPRDPMPSCSVSH
jgi:hypothetical protein